jgi:hypothetical protein
MRSWDYGDGDFRLFPVELVIGGVTWDYVIVIAEIKLFRIIVSDQAEAPPIL